MLSIVRRVVRRSVRMPRQKRERFRDVATESAMFLTGRYAERLMARGKAVPDWAWLNILAHSSAESVEQIAQHGLSLSHWRSRKAVTADVEILTWQRTVHYLAGEMVRRAEIHQIPISELQRPGLVDLELELARRADASGSGDIGVFSPAQLAVTVLSELDNPISHTP